jgi:hypothetical protein
MHRKVLKELGTMPVIPALPTLRKLRQEEDCKVEACVDSTLFKPCFKKKNQPNRSPQGSIKLLIVITVGWGGVEFV